MGGLLFVLGEWFYGGDLGSVCGGIVWDLELFCWLRFWFFCILFWGRRGWGVGVFLKGFGLLVFVFVFGFLWFGRL